MGVGSLHFFYNGIGHLGCSYGGGVVSVGFHVVSYIFAFGNNCGDGGFEFVGFGHFVDVAEHHRNSRPKVYRDGPENKNI